MGAVAWKRTGRHGRQRLKASGYIDESPLNGAELGGSRGWHSGQARRLRLVGMGVVVASVLAGCASSPEAVRVRGEPGADPGNHGNPVELLAPPDRVERVYYEIPYDGPSVASEDTSQS